MDLLYVFQLVGLDLRAKPVVLKRLKLKEQEVVINARHGDAHRPVVD